MMGIKMGFTERQIGHMTMKKYSKLLKAYKDIFDIEMTLTTNKIKYSEIGASTSIDEAIPL
jgi:hypothetical protein